MTFLKDLASALIFRDSSIAAMAARHKTGAAALILSAGCLCFLIVRKTVYRDLLESAPEAANGYPILDWSMAVTLLRVLLFLLVIYIPAIAALSGMISGRVRGLLVTGDACRSLISGLFPLWGAAFFIAAPVQLLVPHFVVAQPVAVSTGLLLFLIMWLTYSIRGIREVGGISTLRATIVFLFATVALPVIYLLAGFLLGLL